MSTEITKQADSVVGLCHHYVGKVWILRNVPFPEEADATVARTLMVDFLLVRRATSRVDSCYNTKSKLILLSGGGWGNSALPDKVDCFVVTLCV